MLLRIRVASGTKLLKSRHLFRLDLLYLAQVRAFWRFGQEAEID